MDNLELIRTADFAARKHSTQRRKDTEQTPYINHPIGVATIIAVEGHVHETAILQAAMLHDTGTNQRLWLHADAYVAHAS